MAGPPRQPPIGLELAQVAKAVSRAFDDALAAAGGSRPTWLIVLALKQRAWRTQREIAAAVGIEGATLTHHLDGLERSRLIRRSRDPEDRRVMRVELTLAGDELFGRLRGAAAGFDRRLRAGLDEDDLEAFRRVLGQLAANVSAAAPA
jgi:MarR family transcriptional regulator, transcriptional regulator for hemolysin